MGCDYNKSGFRPQAIVSWIDRHQEFRRSSLRINIRKRRCTRPDTNLGTGTPAIENRGGRDNHRRGYETVTSACQMGLVRPESAGASGLDRVGWVSALNIISLLNKFGSSAR